MWPVALKTAVGIVLGARHPMFLFWGPEHIQFYNDAFKPSFGEGKHPAAMGQRGRECWSEIWEIVGPQIDGAMKEGKPSWNVDHFVPIVRNGRMEEVYWSYGYSSVPADEPGEIGGALVVCSETTAHILSKRRSILLQSLSARLANARDPAEVIPAAAHCLTECVHDLPCVFFRQKRETSIAAVDAHGAVAESILDEALRGGAERPVKRTLSKALPGSPWPEPVTDVFAVPIEGFPGDVVVFGLSPRLPFDHAYEAFLQAIVDLIAQARARTQVEAERRRLFLVAPVATALMVGPEHRFQVANPLFCDLVARDVVGRTLRDAFPELTGSPVVDLLDRVLRTGESVSVTEQLVTLVDPRTGAREERFLRFNLEPFRRDGEVAGVVAVALDVGEQVKARRTLEETSRERERLLADADAAARAKDAFLAMLGHELRNPLAPIITAVEVMRLKGSPHSARERDIIERQARHLVRLVDDLLDVSRVQRGKIELRKTHIALSEIVMRAVEVARPLFDQKAQELRIDVGGDLVVDADPVRMSQVVANLLTNAAKYTDRGGRVVVRATCDHDRVSLDVEDDGRGLAPEQLSHLFEAFFQGPRAKDRAEGGLGLGLTLVKSLVELHGGSVSAKSQGPGKGSVFTLSIPAAKADAAHPASEAPSIDMSPPRSPTRILMVDDNPDITSLVGEILEQAGFDVRIASDGPRALDLAATFHPNIAILDIGLPVMDGYELAGRLRELLGHAAPRMIAMSGYGQKEDRENSRRAGFDRHLVKPVEAQVLLSAIRGSSCVPGEAVDAPSLVEPTSVEGSTGTWGMPATGAGEPIVRG